MSPPSWASARSTYVPRSRNVALTVHLLSGGTGGVLHPADQGELPPSRRSSHTLVCGGSNSTAPAPRYLNHDRRRPVAELGTKWLWPTRKAGIGRGLGLPSSVATAVSVTGCPTETVRRFSPSSVSLGGLFPIMSGTKPV